ncbi:hypothetical protein, partial [Ructibacterium gallinarum]
DFLLISAAAGRNFVFSSNSLGSGEARALLGRRRSKAADVVLPPLGKTELSELCRRPGTSAAKGFRKVTGLTPAEACAGFSSYLCGCGQELCLFLKFARQW